MLKKPQFDSMHCWQYMFPAQKHDWKGNTMNEITLCRYFNITWISDFLCHLQLQDSGPSSTVLIRNQTGKIVAFCLPANQASRVCQVKEMVWSICNFWGVYTHINLSNMALIYSKHHTKYSYLEWKKGDYFKRCIGILQIRNLDYDLHQIKWLRMGFVK